MSRFQENLQVISSLLLPGTTPFAEFVSLAEAKPASPVRHELGKTGRSTLRIEGGGRYIHSRYDPWREATRLASRQQGYLVLLGVGCGYLAAAAASSPGIAGVLAIEPDPAVAATVAREADLTHLHSLPAKMRLLYTDSPRLMRDAVAAFYLPALHEKVTLQVTEGYDSLLELYPFKEAFREGVERAVGNYRTMASLGRSWTRNIIINATELATAGSSELATAGSPALGLLGEPIRPPRRAAILGAGPSLEDWLLRAAPQSENLLLLAADTALPALLARGVKPHLVASIDSQVATYHHYLSSSRLFSDPLPPEEKPLVVADLTAPPLLGRIGGRVAFFGGGHPLAELLLESSRTLRGLSTEGGNVGYTLLSAAVALGAKEVEIAGIDYAYLEGRGYARGSYLDHYFLSRIDRESSLISRWTALLWRDSDSRQMAGRSPWSYADPRLLRFAESFDRAVRSYQARGIVIRHDSFSLEAPSGGAGAERIPPVLPADGIEENLNELAESLRKSVSAAPRPVWLLSREEKALLPLTAWYREHPHRGAGDPLEAARRLTLEYLARRVP